MSGPDVMTMACPSSDCHGWFQWSEWDGGPGVCDACGKSFMQVNNELQQDREEKFLKEYREWADDNLRLIDSIGVSMQDSVIMDDASIEAFMKQRCMIEKEGENDE